ncbi:protein kinase domain-containing protein [Aquabacterium sp.]|uniref:protein kinase domain-containing protein n=1 Tax=Aquabacterium sp. TaxID=1872578 RepID=UPI002C619E72|nr:cache domain-containing protein [Aquabacterium sp.]HSW07096.1 cache domain-containing protein [Aquabacterium sp.]
MSSDRPPSDADATRVRPPVPDADADADATRVRPPVPDPDATWVRTTPARKPAPADDTTIARTVPLTGTHTTVLRRGEAPATPLPEALARKAPLALQPGFRLHEYRIESVLGQGGFGITYLATDVNLRAPVAIKEYLPEEIAFRAGDRSVSPNAVRHRERYQFGLEAFLVEARTLATFRHPNIVRVARFFEAHHTAYMVLEYERGSPLRGWWPEHQAIGERGLVARLQPLLDGLAVVHAAGFLHRDIKPDNIQVRQDDGRFVLLDFGSAGQTVALAEAEAVIVTPGFAPIEQYGIGEQGAWTDIYALGATLYWAVSGHKPPDAEARATGAAMKSAVDIGRGRYGENFLRAVDWALQPDAAQRPRDIAAWRQALLADHLTTLGLKEALRGGDAMTEPAGSTGAGAALRRGGTALRTVFTPSAWPLAVKMTLAMVVTALLPMLVTAAYNLSQSQQALTASQLNQAELLAHNTAGRLAQLINDSQNLARVLGTDIDFARYLAQPDPAARPALRDKLVAVTKANRDIHLVMVMDTAGTTLVSSDANLIDRNFRFRQYFQEAMAGRTFVTSLVVGAVAGATGVFFSMPVFDAQQTVIGAVVLRIHGSSFAAILDEVRHDSILTPFLIDGDGVLVHHPREDLLYRSLMPLPAPTLEAIRADQRFRRDTIVSLNQPRLAAAMVGATKAGHVAYRSNLSGVDEIAGFAPVPGHHWVVGVSEPRSAFEAPLMLLYNHLLWSVGLIGLLFTGLALRFARSIVRPIQALTGAAHALKAGDFDRAAITVHSRDEVGQLARTFNVMVDVLRQREREREAAPPPGDAHR